MARIPQYVSNDKASTEAPAVMQRDEKVGVMADAGLVDNSAGSFAGKQLQELGEKMIKLENANDNSKAEIQTTSQMLALEDQITKDPSTFKDYDSAMQKIGDSSLKQFRNPQARDEYKQKFDLQNIIFKNKMQGVVYKKEVDLGRTNTIKEMDLESSNYINAQDEGEKIASRQKIEAKMDNAVKAGLFTNEQGMDEVEKIIKSSEDAIKDNKALARRKEKELALAQKEAVNARENEYIKMKITGVDKLNTPISREELVKSARKDVDAGAVSPKFAEIYINALKSPKAVKAKTIDKDFANVMFEINQGKMKPQAIRTAILDLVSNGNLSEDDEKNATAYLDMLGEKNPNDLVSEGKRGFMSGLFNFAINNNSKEKESESRARLSRNYLGKLNSGIEASVAAAEAMREEVLILQPEAKNYPEGMTFIDNAGRMKTIMPNGDLLEVETKPKTPSKGK